MSEAPSLAAGRLEGGSPEGGRLEEAGVAAAGVAEAGVEEAGVEEDGLDLPDVERCSTRSRRFGESLMGTASTVRSWLLLEQPGPWDASSALASRRLPAGLGAELARRANRHRVRVVLIRRHGRSDASAPPTCFVASSSANGSWLGQVALRSAVDVLDLDLSTLAAGHVAGADEVAGPLFCVCTHGRHDPCCAERGRPVAAALAAQFPDQTWEISHIGGDRFAGNVVCLPDGDYLGWVTPEDAGAIAQEYLDGDYRLANLRGRSVHPPAVQAAEILVRKRLGVTARQAVRIIDVDRRTEDVLVRMDILGHGVMSARLRTEPAPPARQLTCTATGVQQPPSYDLIELI